MSWTWINSWRRTPILERVPGESQDRATVNISGEATLLRVFLNASDRLHGKAVYQVVVETARALHLAGASVFLVDFSFGAHQRIRDAKSDYLSFDIPVVVEIVDAVENVGKMLTELESMIVEGLVVTRPVRVIRYAGDPIRKRNPRVPCRSMSQTRHATAGVRRR